MIGVVMKKSVIIGIIATVTGLAAGITFLR